MPASSENPPVITSPVITPRGVELPGGAGIPVDARRMACDLLRRARSGVLSTLDPGGYPLGSVTNIATMPDGTPFFFAALLAVHARNVLADPRAALTLAEFGKGDALTQPRLGLVGKVEMLAGDQEPLRQRYLRRHPKGRLYLSLPDARLFKLTVEGVHLGAGPGRNAAQLTPADLVTDLAGADELMAREEELIAEMNAERGLAERLALSVAGAPGRWQAVGIDPAGIDLMDGDATARVNFKARVVDAATLRAALADPTSTLS
ncbi:MAG: HugZ family protein [Rhodospirillaceae bacterium]|nr:HugZ family protein [Rhodospirillaceae bacterium]